MQRIFFQLHRNKVQFVAFVNMNAAFFFVFLTQVFDILFAQTLPIFQNVSGFWFWDCGTPARYVGRSSIHTDIITKGTIFMIVSA